MNSLPCLRTILLLALLIPVPAAAVCGDVNGDSKRTAADALAVLRSAVGQTVDLRCDAGPSRMRFFNDFSCPTGSSISVATFGNFSFEADSGEYSSVESVASPEIDNIEIGLCGATYSFEGPVFLPPGRSLTFFMVLADPAIYDLGVDDPAFLVVYDEGDGSPQGASSPGGELTVLSVTEVGGELSSASPEPARRVE